MKQSLKKMASYYGQAQRAIRTEYDHFKLRKKINHLNKLQHTKKLTPAQREEISEFYRAYGFKNFNCSWHQYYTGCNGIFSVKYIPENIFYLILEPKLNSYAFASALSDKNLLDRIFPDIRQPEVVAKNINGLYLHSGEIITRDTVTGLCNEAGKMIIKPAINSFGGRDVVLFKCDAGITDVGQKPLEQLLSHYKKDFIIQKSLSQHPLMERLNTTSVNTFRVVTYLKGQHARVLSIMVRMGRKGATNDNVTTGGFSVGVREDGTINAVGYDIHGKQVTESDSGLRFAEIRFPFVDKLKEAAIRLHIQAPHFRIISWDMTFDPAEEVVLIEYNIYGQGINSHQLHHGPVFSELLEELR